jgi:succinate-acetate transporter protein
VDQRDAADSAADPAPRIAPERQRMPFGVGLFLAYALVILIGVALSLRTVVDMATLAPVTLPGVVVMILLAYTIFTTTLVIQRKKAAFGLAIGLSSLTLPLVLLLAVSPVHPALPVFAAAFSLLLFRGLLRPDVRVYLSED